MNNLLFVATSVVETMEHMTDEFFYHEAALIARFNPDDYSFKDAIPARAVRVGDICALHRGRQILGHPVPGIFRVTGGPVVIGTYE